MSLGLRNLNSFWKLTKPTIEFELPNLDNSRKRFATNPSNTPSADNPNFTEACFRCFSLDPSLSNLPVQLMKIPVELPDDPMFAPVMDISV